MMQRLRFIGKVIMNSVNKWIADDIPMHGAALSFYTIFSLAPVLIIIITLISWLWGDQAGIYQVQRTLEEFLDPQLTKTILDIVENASSSRGVALPIIGFGTLLFAATTAIAQLKNTLNLIWNVRIKDGKGLAQFALDRFLALVMVLGLSLLLMLSVIGDTLIYALAPYIDPLLPFDLSFVESVNQILLWFFTLLLFTVIFKMLPDVALRWRDVVIGAAVTTALFMLGKSLIDWYLRSLTTYDAFGAAGTFVVFLFWVYYNAQVIFLGAEFTQVYLAMKGRPMTAKRFAYFGDT